MNIKVLCLETLRARDINLNRDCYYCGEPATVKGYCDNHYSKQHYRKIPLSDLDKCLSTLAEIDQKKIISDDIIYDEAEELIGIPDVEEEEYN